MDVGFMDILKKMAAHWRETKVKITTSWKKEKTEQRNRIHFNVRYKYRQGICIKDQTWMWVHEMEILFSTLLRLSKWTHTNNDKPVQKED